MLITEMKQKEAILSHVNGKAFMIVCHGCKEVHFPEHEVEAFRKELAENGTLTGSITTDYICNEENLAVRLQNHMAAIESADVVLVFSCGVGVQTVAGKFPGKKVVACCDTNALPGFQGVTPLEYDCRQCGEC